MKPQSPHETILRAVIIVACVLLIYFTHFEASASSQSCTVVPPLYTDRDPYTWSWPSNKQVYFFIDDQWEPAERDHFANGITKWNDWKTYNCSNVNFDVLGSRHFTDYSEEPPPFVVYWQKTDPQNGTYLGAVRANFGGIPRRIISVNQKISPTATNNNNYYDHLGSHEMGHTFGLDECTCSNGCTCEPNQSRMAGQFNDPVKDAAGLSACDNQNIRLLYCNVNTPAPTPTPTPDCLKGNCSPSAKAEYQFSSLT